MATCNIELSKHSNFSLLYKIIYYLSTYIAELKK